MTDYGLKFRWSKIPFILLLLYDTAYHFLKKSTTTSKVKF